MPPVWFPAGVNVTPVGPVRLRFPSGGCHVTLKNGCYNFDAYSISEGKKMVENVELSTTIP